MENKLPTYGNGKICYVEIPAIDIAASAKFYEAVFGWHIRIRGNGSVAFDDGIGEVSGTWVLGRKPSTAQGLVVSVMVDDIEETIRTLEASGSKIVNRINIGDTEFIAWFTDPGGNIIGLYQHPGGGHGKICYLEIPAGDIDRSAGFYEAVFAWPLRDKGTENVAFDDGTGVVSGMWTLGRQPSPEPGLLIYVVVDRVADTVEKVIANGGPNCATHRYGFARNYCTFQRSVWECVRALSKSCLERKAKSRKCKALFCTLIRLSALVF